MPSLPPKYHINREVSLMKIIFSKATSFTSLSIWDYFLYNNVRDNTKELNYCW
jgi:hypothetical protein